MQKTLLICLLGYLCLPTSTLTAQVADSPPETDFLHRSGPSVSLGLGDTHRGGDSRPDTFLPENLGLVDIDQDFASNWSRYRPSTTNQERHGALYLELDGGPTPRLKSNHPSAVPLAGKPEKQHSRMAKISSAEFKTAQVADSPPETDLVDYSGLPAGNRIADFSVNDLKVGIPGQEGASPSARLDTLTIGDQIPSGIEFSEVLQFDSDKLRLDDYRGKYVILQFWATWCTASSGSLPKADQLQEIFKDQIQFVPVTYETGAKVGKKLAFYSSMRDLDLPLIVDEHRLNKLFPHIILPHLVILDPMGKILAITGSEDITEENLREMITTGKADFRLKADNRIPFSINENLISGNTHIPSKNIRYQSALTGYLPGVSGGMIDDREDGAHIILINNPLIKFYRLAYTGRDLANFFGPNRMIFKGFGEDELDTRKSGLDYIEWMKEGNRVYSYELIAPPGFDQYQMMREDLKRYFPEIKAEVQTQKRKVWAIVLPKGKTYPRSVAERSYEFNPYEAKLRNYPLLGLIYQLNIYSLQLSPYPLIDLTGIDYPIDLALEANFSNPEELKKSLQKAGLDLQLRETEIPVLVLSKQDSLTQNNP